MRLAVAAFAALGLAFAARADEDWGPRTARVSVLQGEARGLSPFDDGDFELTENAVLRGGDEVRAAGTTFAEVELPSDSFLRLGPDSGATLSSLTASGAEVAVTDGPVAVSRGGDAPVDVVTSAGTLVLARNAHVRVDDDGAGQLLVVAYRGEAELRVDARAWRVGEGDELSWPEGEVRRSRRRDAFDEWTLQREREVRALAPAVHLGAGYTGWRDLHRHGRWERIDGSWGWCPAGVEVSWRPYSAGYWAWREPFGWTWVSYHRWGYVTSHYGRWHHGSRGWCWYPDRAWSPAWVTWARFGDRLGWAPCDFRGRPISRDPRTHYDPRSWSHCDARELSDDGPSREPRRTTVRWADDELFARTRPVPVRDARLDLPTRGSEAAAPSAGTSERPVIVTSPRARVTAPTLRERAPTATGAPVSRLRGRIEDTQAPALPETQAPSRRLTLPAFERRERTLPASAPRALPPTTTSRSTTIVPRPTPRAVPVPPRVPRAAPTPVPRAAPRAVPLPARRPAPPPARPEESREKRSDGG